MRVHISSTVEIPTYQRLHDFARDRGIVHPTSGRVNLSDAVRTALVLALGTGDEGDAGKRGHEQAND